MGGALPPEASRAVIAASAWISPAPESLSNPAAPMSIAEACNALCTWAGVALGLACNMMAATPAACGAAADVPKKSSMPSLP
jgi:hypothetical protein